MNARTFQGVKDRSGIDIGVTAGALPDSRLHVVAFGMPTTSEFRSCRLSAFQAGHIPKLARIVRALWPDHQLPPAAPVVVSLMGQAPWRLARRRRRPRLGPVRRKRRRRRGGQLHDSPLVRHQPSSGTVTRHSPRVLQATAVSAAGHSRRTAIAGMPCQEASSPRLPWRRSSWRLRPALAAPRLMSRTVTTRPTCCAQVTAVL